MINLIKTDFLNSSNFICFLISSSIDCRLSAFSDNLFKNLSHRAESVQLPILPQFLMV